MYFHEMMHVPHEPVHIYITGIVLLDENRLSVSLYVLKTSQTGTHDQPAQALD